MKKYYQATFIRLNFEYQSNSLLCILSYFIKNILESYLSSEEMTNVGELSKNKNILRGLSMNLGA